MHKSYENIARKYIHMNYIDLNINQDDTQLRWINTKLLLAKKEDNDFIIVYTPDERQDIAETLLQVDSRIRNIVDTIVIQ